LFLSSRTDVKSPLSFFYTEAMINVRSAKDAWQCRGWEGKDALACSGAVVSETLIEAMLKSSMPQVASTA